MFCVTDIRLCYQICIFAKKELHHTKTYSVNIKHIINTPMTIDFNTQPFESFPNFKGGEKELKAQMFFDGTNRILHGILVPGASIGEHTHDTNSEILFIIKGKGTIIDDGVCSPVEAGQCTYCPKGHSHSLVNTGDADLEFYAAVPNQ